MAAERDVYAAQCSPDVAAVHHVLEVHVMHGVYHLAVQPMAAMPEAYSTPGRTCWLVCAESRR